MSAKENRLSFFRQSGWMVTATVASGALMTAVHVLAATMAPAEYALFGALLRFYLLMGIPAGGLQTVFAQQAAAAHTLQEHHALNAVTRSVLKAIFIIWLVIALVVILAHQYLLRIYDISNPWALWATLALGLACLWMPVFRGLLQGCQNFAGYGWVLILDGGGRFLSVAILVVLLHGQAASGIASAVLGQVVAILVGAWLTRSIWAGLAAPFDWKPWLKRVIPLTLGSGAILFMSNFDVLFIKGVFPGDDTRFYVAGAIIGFALAQFTMPLALVMFPKIARSVARSQATDAMQLTLISTAILGALAAIICTLVPSLPLHVIYFRDPSFLKAAPLVPWFCWCLLILALANVLVANLLAREQFAIVPWLVLITAAYGITLALCRHTLVQMELFAAFKLVVKILGAYNLLLLAVAIGFTWLRKPEPQPLEAVKTPAP